MSRKPLDRVTVTVPSELLRAADRLARKLDRSRSWVVAEAVRRFVALPVAAADPQVAAAGRRRLELDLSLSAEDRLRKADELLQLHRALRPRAPRQQVVGFDSQQDFHRWKRAQQVAAALPS